MHARSRHALAAAVIALALGAPGSRASAQDPARDPPPPGAAAAPREAAPARQASAPRAAGPTAEQIAAAVKALQTGLASKDAAERVAALRSAAQVPSAEVAQAAADGLRDKSPEVELAAMETIGALRTPEGLKELQRLASSNKALRKDAKLYSTLLKEIGRHGDPSSVQVLADNPWENTDASVVRARILGLGNIRDVSAVEELIAMMNKGKPLPGEDAPFMPDFRLALARLTGTDQTTNKTMWQSWWNKNKKGFKLSADPPALPGELQSRWDEYWGLQPAAPAPPAK
jgi:HEAT repeat protein